MYLLGLSEDFKSPEIQNITIIKIVHIYQDYKFRIVNYVVCVIIFTNYIVFHFVAS